DREARLSEMKREQLGLAFHDLRKILLELPTASFMQPPTFGQQQTLVGGVAQQRVLELILSLVRSTERMQHVVGDEERQVGVENRRRDIMDVQQEWRRKMPAEHR